jgi:hypothetical protein
MAETLIAGPYRMLRTPDGVEFPWYMIPFDKRGSCTAPLTRVDLFRQLREGRFTHIYLFSHGWNNDWKTAIGAYEDFMAGYMQMRRASNLPPPQPYRPLLIGVYWPSASLVLPWEKPPQIAGATTFDRDDTLVADHQQCVEAIADELADEQRDRFYELSQLDRLDANAARELAQLLAPVYGAGDEETGDNSRVTPESLLEAWNAVASSSDDDDEEVEDDLDEFGTVDGGVGEPDAAFLSYLNPRFAVRMASVWQMKDRAGRVGVVGVGPLLRSALSACDASVHLIGHSYGCKVLLTAVCKEPLTRSVQSMLLLQPAVSCLCFADDVDGHGTPGGFRSAFDRIDQPILSTFSRHDFPLTKVFHLALRRKRDLGEQRIAGAPPSRYAALGGYGPFGCGAQAEEVEIKLPGNEYDIGNQQVEVFGLRGHEHIGGHNGVSNRSTYWALYDQVTFPRR